MWILDRGLNFTWIFILQNEVDRNDLVLLEAMKTTKQHLSIQIVLTACIPSVDTIDDNRFFCNSTFQKTKSLYTKKECYADVKLF